MYLRSAKWLKVFCILMGMAMFYGCVVNPVTGKQQLNLMSEQQERSIGESSINQVKSMAGFYEENPELTAYFKELGQQMAKISHRPDLQFEFNIVNSPIVNAMAYPGGYVYFYRGILAYFNNEAELAGVLGHEIGHVTARHASTQYNQQIGLQAALVLGGVFSSQVRDNFQELNAGAGLLMLKFGRDDESQADELGVSYSTQVGYDAHYMANFFKTMNEISQRAGGLPPEHLSSHPDPINRYQRVRELSDVAQKRELQTKGSQDYIIGRNEYLRMIDGLVYGEDPREGYFSNNTFYQPVLDFQFPVPQNWQTINMPTQVRMQQADGKAMMIFTLDTQSDLTAALNKQISDLGFTPGAARSLRINGYAAKQAESTASTEDGQAYRLLTTVVEQGDMIYVFHGLSMEADYDAYLSTFKKSMNGFDRIRNSARKNVKPERISIKTNTRRQTLRQALLANRTPQDRLEEVALLNGMELTDELQRGMLFKVVSK